jgi:hypothetical protein
MEQNQQRGEFVQRLRLKSGVAQVLGNRRCGVSG